MASLIVHPSLVALLLEVLSCHFLLANFLNQLFLVSGGFLKGREGGHFTFADGMDLLDILLAETIVEVVVGDGNEVLTHY